MKTILSAIVFSIYFWLIFFNINGVDLTWVDVNYWNISNGLALLLALISLLEKEQ